MRPLRAIWHYIRNTDLYLLVVSLLCSTYGVVLIYSATRSFSNIRNVQIQCLGIGLGLIAFVVMSLFDLERLASLWKGFLVFNILVQLSLIVLGTAEGGNKSWIVLGPLSIQPAEIGKVLYIFTFAAHLTDVRDRINDLKILLGLGLHTLLIMLAITVGSGDMGMAIAYAAICLVMLFTAGLNLKWILGGTVLGLAAVPFVWNFVLKSYQKLRILVLLDPSIDPDKAYQTTQSKIAIGAGQIYGQGYMQGNQTQYSILPAKHTDFIFAVAGEEFGFVGCCLVLALLGLLILRLFYVCYKADSPFSSLLVVGIAGMILFQMFENIFMCLGLLPVMGLTLPFFSYGGTSVMTMFAAVGIAAGVRMREKPSWLRH